MHKILLSFSLLLLSLSLAAKVSLPSVFGDNMVLQQQTDAAFWGTANPGAKVTITTSWAKAKTVVVADADGYWNTTVATPTAGGPFVMSFTDGEEKLVLNNILSGEVWFCSGQSNMQMPVQGFPSQPVEGSMETVLGAKKSVPIRVCSVEPAFNAKEQNFCKCKWRENTPDAVAEASATAYFFAKQLNETLDVPVGIIVSKIGGTKIESWMSRDALQNALPNERLKFLDDKNTKLNFKYACVLFNAMVAPIIPYTIKGWIWYQGEANINDAQRYAVLMPAYAAMMRARWNQPKMPFYYVQIAPYQYTDPDGIKSPLLQEVQEKCLDVIPNCGMATTLDVGDKLCIHPAKKQPVGQRLAALALYNTYGMNVVYPVAPRFKSVEFNDKLAIVKFQMNPAGLAPLGHPLVGFEVAGPDKVFYKAEATISKDRKAVEVTIPSEVSEPVAVRYCFHNYAEGNLTSNWGIPAGPFRSDNW